MDVDVMVDGVVDVSGVMCTRQRVVWWARGSERCVMGTWKRVV